jgi:hypothetical protein
MKTPDTQPAPSGNPAYPSLQDREKLVTENKKNTGEPVKKIPADQLKKHESAGDKTK